MILKTCFLLVVSVAWDVSGIEGISYSKVYVQTGPETAPLEYFNYGASPKIYEYPSSQIAQYNAARYEPFYRSYGYGAPCPSGACVYPEQTVASIEPAAVTYSAPVSNIPSYVYGNNEPLSYSYVFVNNNAGQNLKLSDGEVINGVYPFLQPEGLAQYVADDNQGLNAIIKNYIPNDAVAQTETVNHEIVHHQSVHHAEPCHEAKSAALTEHVSHEEGHEEHHEGHKHHASHEESEEGHEQLHESHEARHGSHEESEVYDYILKDGDSHKDHIIVIHEKEGHHESEPEEQQKTGHESHEHQETQTEDHENQKTEHEDHQHENNEETTHESENTHEAIIESHEHHENHEHQEVPEAALVPAVVGNNVYIPYNDIIKCIQAAVARGNPHPYYTPVAKPPSPLTYLIYNKPC